MSQQQKNIVTMAALKFWIESNSKETFKDFVLEGKRVGNWWGADETLEDVTYAL